jgi:ribosomal protein S18 acetylase RimI-like enzyme
MTFLIRPMQLEHDRATVLRFIDGSQAFEAVFETNRRLDDRVADEHLSRLLTDMAETQGQAFVADAGGVVIGWACCLVQVHGVFVAAEERRHGYISEVYVEATHRGRHVGRALIAACEGHFKTLGLKTAFIGVLSGNERAISAYRSAGYSDYAVEMRKRLE